MKTELPKLKQRQKEILILLYKFRFLNTQHIQILLNHKHREKIRVWLNDLTEKKYLKRYYSKKFGGTAAIYSLGLTSRRYFKEKKIKDVQVLLLDRIYREHKYTFQFKKHCMFLSEIYISLLSLAKKNKVKLRFFTNTDLRGMRYIVLPEPDAYFALEGKDKSAKRYFLDIIDNFTLNKDLKKRVEQYSNYFNKKYWQDHTGHDFPEVIMVCPDSRSKRYLDGQISKILYDEDANILFYLSTWSEIKSQGMKSEVLHKVEVD